MAVSGGGLQDSGLDRALRLALKAELDDVLLSGELWPGERQDFPEPIPGVDKVDRPWQRGLDQKPEPAGEPLIPLLRRSIDLSRWPPTSPPPLADPETPRGVDAVPSIDPARYKRARQQADARKSDRRLARKQEYLKWKRDRVGVVMIHGIGPQLAGQTLLDWTRPIITLIKDAAVAQGSEFALEEDAAPAADIAGGEPGKTRRRTVTDPVTKSNIDFSGETFPVVQVRIPARKDVDEGDPRGERRTWVFTETWWASEIRAPSLPTMIGWLGEQGGVGRIVQGIEQNMLGSGPLARISKVSLAPIISVVTSFVLTIFLVLLGLAKLIPFGPLRDAVVLRLAASFLTDWFGGARTLLLDPAQSANVRHRLVMTIKALRAYGCRDVVVIAHSGGTMVSLMTLTDPAFEGLRVEKLITIGEALNLGWRLNDRNPDGPRPTPPAGDRMAGDIGRLQPDLQWRDFWATHDPAPSGPPLLPEGFKTPPLPLQFSQERIYNRMALLEDHGTYWDNDEQFLVPLMREIDVPTGDRGASRFYSDDDERKLRWKRRERVSLRALWRRGLQALPLLAIVAAATVSAPGFVAIAGGFALSLLGLIPGSDTVGDFFDSFVKFFNDISLQGVPLMPDFLRVQSLGASLYRLGTWTLEGLLVLTLFPVVLPGWVDRLWGTRPWARLIVVSLDLFVGLGVAALIVIGFFFVISPEDRSRIWDAVGWDLLWLVVVGLGVLFVGWLGRLLRTRLRATRETANQRPRVRFGRDALVVASSLFLGAILLIVTAMAIGVTLVVVDGTTEMPADGTQVHAEIERFVIGAIAVLVGFRLLMRLGTWRWGSWDVRERRSLRRKPSGKTPREWPYTLAVILALIAFGVTMLVAFGADGATWLWLPRDTWLVLLGGVILAVIVVCLGKDVVDNDISVLGDGVTGDQPPVEPPPAKTPA
jgi:hypothetical protein